MLESFAYHGITVSDLDRSIHFYRDLLHMTLEKTYEASGESLERATGLPGARMSEAIFSYDDIFGHHFLKAMRCLSPLGKKRFEGRLCDVGTSHMDVYADKLNEACEELRAEQVRFFSSPVTPRPDHPEKPFTYMLDPDGIVIELHRAVSHHAHIVSDLDRAVAFYRDTLGMKLDYIIDITGPGIAEGTGFPGAHLRSAHLLLHSGGGGEYIELHHYVNPSGKTSSDMRLCDVGCSHVAFTVEDVQRCYDELRPNDVRFLSQPLKETAGEQEATMVYLLDPDNYTIELRSAGALI